MPNGQFFRVVLDGEVHAPGSDRLVLYESDPSVIEDGYLGGWRRGDHAGSLIKIHDPEYVYVAEGVTLHRREFTELPDTPNPVNMADVTFTSDGTIPVGAMEGFLEIYDSSFALLHSDSGTNFSAYNSPPYYDAVRVWLSVNITMPAGGGYVAFRLHNTSSRSITTAAATSADLRLTWSTPDVLDPVQPKDQQFGRVVNLDEVVPIRALDLKPGSVARPSSDLGWRPGVPHMIVYVSQNVGRSAWDESVDLACGPGYGWVFPHTTNEAFWPSASWVQPASSRGRPVHINAFKGPAYMEGHYGQYGDPGFTYNPANNPGYPPYVVGRDVIWNSATKRWDGVPLGNIEPNYPPGYPAPGEGIHGFEAFGRPGDAWIGGPEVTTAQMALNALAELDISVMHLEGGNTGWWYIGPVLPGGGIWEWPEPQPRMNWEKLNRMLTNPHLDYDLLSMGNQDQFVYATDTASGFAPHIWSQYFDTDVMPDYYYTLHHTHGPLVEGCGLGFLTGAVGADNRNIAWNLSQFSQLPNGNLGPSEGQVSLARRMADDILDHAEALGNRESFDLAFLGSSTGYLDYASTLIELVRNLLAEAPDVWVSNAEYGGYSYRTIPWFDSGSWDTDDEEDRRRFDWGVPFVRINPMRPAAELIESEGTTAPLAVTSDALRFGTGHSVLWEALYQLATGVGFDANGNGSTFDSGPTYGHGLPPYPYDNLLDPNSPEFAEMDGAWDESGYYWDPDSPWNDPDATGVGTGYGWPGNSGDIPAVKAPREPATAGTRENRVVRYPKTGPRGGVS